jgi:hypothetical protein
VVWRKGRQVGAKVASRAFPTRLTPYRRRHCELDCFGGLIRDPAPCHQAKRRAATPFASVPSLRIPCSSSCAIGAAPRYVESSTPGA